MPDSHIKLVNLSNKTSPADSDVIYTRAFKGFYRNLRLCGSSFLFVLYFGTIWLQKDNKPLVLFDIIKRQFHIFGTTFYPQDFIFLTLLLIISAFGLFFITVLAGRIWCGYTCPQSVFTWFFLRIEHWIEGDRNYRIAADKKRKIFHFYVKKLCKHFLWLLVALVTAITFVGYFVPVRELLSELITLQIGSWPLFWMIFFTLVTYGNAGWLREKVCIFMCPYARFQSVMFDSNTLIVAYDEQRGEPRGRHKKNCKEIGSQQQSGDCIDCTMCVQVCPTGIDIRNGLQYKCIGCAACVDACNAVMDKLGFKRNLVGYTTENKQKGKTINWFRGRLVGYLFVLLVAGASFFWMLNHRDPFELNVLRDRQILYRVRPDGAVENVYLLSIFNKQKSAALFRLSVSGLEDLEYTQLFSGTTTIASGESINLPVNVKVPFGSMDGKLFQNILFTVTLVTEEGMSVVAETKESRFIAPSSLLDDMRAPNARK